MQGFDLDSGLQSEKHGLDLFKAPPRSAVLAPQRGRVFRGFRPEALSELVDKSDNIFNEERALEVVRAQEGNKLTRRAKNNDEIGKKQRRNITRRRGLGKRALLGGPGRPISRRYLATCLAYWPAVPALLSAGRSSCK